MSRLIIISGRSGAGKTTAAHAFEDLGYFVVDNLPPQLLDDLLLLVKNSQERMKKIAIIADVREIEFLRTLPEKWQSINQNDYDKLLIFLDASDEKIIHRYQETKRRHPLNNGIGVRAALDRENKLLLPIKKLANKIIFTDNLTAHALRSFLQTEFSEETSYLNLTLMSFGFKYGVPNELDLCFDVRFLHNPFYQAQLRSKSGLEKEVFDYVFNFDEAKSFLQKLTDMIDFLYPLYHKEGKANLTIAVGCTGGRHRSVSIIEALYEQMKDKIDSIRVEHRDLDRHT
ncbi:MAG: RNase adapter RapZ [Myxococcales bacterium]|nr:RNase adapter RapZ [Myxococcales bacterium]USN49865.1 MAG: RNase adapter RapZ [Myxococcales bacterium]